MKPKKQNRLPYDAGARNVHYNIRRGNTTDHKGRPTGEHPSEVHPRKREKE
jgi:hypothetical protein